jgi:hypothetical protein
VAFVLKEVKSGQQQMQQMAIAVDALRQENSSLRKELGKTRMELTKVQGQLASRGGAVEEALYRTNATFDRCEENIIAVLSSPCLRQLAPAKATAPGTCPDQQFSPEGDAHLQATPQPQPVDAVTQNHQGNGETTSSSIKQGQHAQATSEFRIGAIEFTAEPGGRGASTAALGYVTEAMRAVGVYCPAKIVDVLPSKRCKQPPIIVSALPQDYGSLLLHKLADPTTRVQLSTSHGKVKRNLSYEEFKRQQAL